MGLVVRKVAHMWPMQPPPLDPPLGLSTALLCISCFRMTFQDFHSNFKKMEICYLGPDSMATDEDDARQWECKLMEGAWRRNVNAGGCRNFPSQCSNNPDPELFDRSSCNKITSKHPFCYRNLMEDKVLK